jgi:hypothetical protein
MRRWRFAILACTMAAACTAAMGPGERREPGIIDIYPDGSGSGVLQLPEEIRAGVGFQATVTTFGSSSCNRADGAGVSQSGRVAEIVPYDLQASGGTDCTADLHAFPRTVTLRFATPGDAVVRVRGRSLYRPEAVVEQHVTVRL